jgi:peptidyl-prolyl cis-trans isomerase-like 3
MALTFHTSQGDIKVEIFCDTVPKASENFLALAASGYYNDSLFHRNMKGLKSSIFYILYIKDMFVKCQIGFMLQGGDPTGTGKGGEAVWGGVFDDEFNLLYKHGINVNVVFLSFL